MPSNVAPMHFGSNIFIKLTAKQYRYYELAAVSYKTVESLYRAGLEGIKGDIKGKTD